MINERRGLPRLFFSCAKTSLQRAFACPWPVPRARNQRVEVRDLLDPVLAATSRSTSVSLACDALGRYDSDTIHHHLRKLDAKASLAYSRRVNSNLLAEARRNGLLRDPQVVAVDTHKDPDYTHDHADCIKARGARGTSFVLDYLSLETTGENRLTLAFGPVTNENPVRECYREILQQALLEAPIRMLLADRGMFGTPLMQAAHELGIPYVIAAQRNNVVARHIRENERSARRIPRRPGHRFAEVTLTFHPARRHRFTTTLILFWRPDKHASRSVCFPFATSERHLSAARAYELAYLYLKRWDIETGYRIKNKLRVRTCSPHAGIRRFLQYFSILGHNLWILQRSLTRTKNAKTLVTVRLFQVMLDKLVAERAL
jgi:hypothetical protein